MAHYTGPVCRLCRRQGEKLMLKGERCLGPKCALERRHTAPRQRYTRRRRVSEYGTQLKEKQKARQIYSVLERQFRRSFEEAARRPGLVGENLLRILEQRLDNVVYRLGFADSRAQARQIVRHGHITVNGRKTDIPSCQVRVGDAIGWKESSTKLDIYRNVAQGAERLTLPRWLSLDPAAMTGKVVNIPPRGEIESTIDERLIVEFYSR